MSMLMTLLVGCGGSGRLTVITGSTGLTFYAVVPDISYYDSLVQGHFQYYAVNIRPGYTYTVYLETTFGDSDLYLYSDSSLSNYSLFAYSENNDLTPDSISFYSDRFDTIYIEVGAYLSSDYFLTVSRY
jgi:hypothetical protein